MALISCPQCGKSISDKAVKCPHCKKDVTFDTGNLKDEAESEIVAQSDVHSPQSRPIPTLNVAVQPKLQNAVGVESSDNAKNSSKWLIIIIVVVAFGFVAYIYYQNSTKDELADSSNVEQFNNAKCDVCDNVSVGYSTADSVKDDVNERLIDEFKNFRTMDLSAFMLHGHVKRLMILKEGYGDIYDDDISNDDVRWYFDFSEKGMLTNVSVDEEQMQCRFSRRGNKLVIQFGNTNDYNYFEWHYLLDNSDHLIQYGVCSESNDCWTTYTNHDSNGWPTKASMSCRKSDIPPTNETYKYSQIDEYGNWTLQKSIGVDGGEISTCRSIEYY